MGPATGVATPRCGAYIGAEELHVRRVGTDVAVVALRTRMAGSYAGTLFSGTASYTRIWAREEGRWRIVARQIVTSHEFTADGSSINTDTQYLRSRRDRTDISYERH